MADFQPVALIVFSNPSGSLRLRLDKEHRAIDQLLEKLHLDSRIVTRIHATSVDDLMAALSKAPYEIVQFSGHGTDEAFLLEEATGDGIVLLSAERMADIISETSPGIKALLFVSCFSSASIPTLVRATPYLITVAGAVSDEISIKFVEQFYLNYLPSKSIEKAFKLAQIRALVGAKDDELNAVLSRRAEESHPDAVLFQVFPGMVGDSILIDLSEAENDIAALGIPRDRFLSLLSRKIRIHRWVFDHPRDRTVLSLGPYFGLFSWKNPDDVVTCHSVLRIKDDASQEACNTWAALIVTYNDHYMDQYRVLPDGTENPMMQKALAKAIDGHFRTFSAFFEGNEHASILEEIAPQQFKSTKALAQANLRLCDLKYHQEDYGSAIVYLETTLSSIHDLVDSITDALTV